MMKAFARYFYDNKWHLRPLFVDPTIDFVYAHHALVANPFDNPYIVSIAMRDGNMYIGVADRKD